MPKEIEITCSDGFVLEATVFDTDPSNQKRKVLIINSATAVSKNLYRHYAIYMASSGYEVIIYDYRGIAASRPEKLIGFQASFSDWGQKDFTAVLKYAKHYYPSHAILVLGHSIGGTIIGMSKDCFVIDAALTIGAQTSYYKDWGKGKWKLYFLWHICFPMLTTVFGFFPGKRLGISEDVPKGVVRQWHARRKSENMVRQLNEEGKELYFDTFRGKLLTMAIADDSIGTERALKRIHELFTHADKHMEFVSPKDVDGQKIGHFGFFSRKFKDTLWPKTLVWFDGIQK